MKEALNTKNDELMLEKGTELLDNLTNLAVELNLATHTMWASANNTTDVDDRDAQK